MTYTPKLNNRIIVTTAAQLSWTLSSSIEYLVDWEINMGTTEINIPANWITITGLWFNISKLYSEENNYTMFDWAWVDWDVAIQGLELSVWGTLSKIFNVDNEWNNNAMEFIDCNIWSFARLTTSFGDITEYRQVRFAWCWFINYSDWFTLNNTFSWWLAVTDSIILSSQSGSSLFKEGTSLVLQGSSTSNINAWSGLNALNTIVWDFQPSNIQDDGGFTLDWARFWSLTNPLPNFPETSTKAFFRDCVGITNTRPWFETEFTAEVTTPLTEDILAKALWTTVTTNSIWWGQTGNNEVTYLSTLKKDFKVTWNITLDWGANDNLSIVIRKWDNSESSYVDLKTKTQNVSNIIWWSDVAIFTVITRWEFEINDRIELWIRNNDDNTDATVVQSVSELFVEVI